MMSRHARAILGVVRADIDELERELAIGAGAPASSTRLEVSSFLVALRLRLILAVTNEPEVHLSATALDSRWRALVPEIERRRFHAREAS